ncbi:MAG: hypothetical protein OXG24_04050 [Gammaproteobacteria bacterium]|nr:hypothetical protein [Gammaproteobacteria bacterium]
MGAAAKAQSEGYHKSFTEETGVQIKFEDHNGGLAQIQAQVDSGAVHWDVVDDESASLQIRCDAASFHDPSTLPPAVSLLARCARKNRKVHVARHHEAHQKQDHLVDPFGLFALGAN